MTNSPVYSEQLKLNAFWSTKDRTHELPGSIQSPDRFVRGSYYNEQLPPTSDPRQALAGVMSVMRNISVPWGTPDPEHPEHLAHLVAHPDRSEKPGVLLRLSPLAANGVGESQPDRSGAWQWRARRSD